MLMMTRILSLFRATVAILLLSPIVSYSETNTIQELLFEPVDEKRGREVPVKVYYRKSNNPQPLILFSHGLGGSRENNAYLGKYWAAAGYVAVFMQHKGSDQDVWKSARIGKRMAALKAAASAETALQRFVDVPFVIDQLENWHKKDGHPLNKKLDLEHIGVSGHSYGAITTMAVAGRKYPFNQNFYDNRIDAFLALSPSPGKDIDPSEAFGQITSPILCMTGTLDSSPIGQMNPLERQKVFTALPVGDKYQLVLQGAKHFAFGDIKSRRTKGRNPKHHPAIQQISLQFFEAYLKNDTVSKQWLQSNKAITETGLSKTDVWEWK